ncbi:MAG: DMT family transporter [Candidatus Cloacimonetes bacterium]|nr:DMT family transporter [Candidatus Cloacimonadota bacterium]
MYSNFLLLITAAIWGFAFVAQRLGMESLDAFSFNALRFALGALFVRLVYYRQFKKPAQPQAFPWKLGLLLFIAATLQQLGIIFTSAGAAGFITGLYVVFVPIIGYFKGQKPARVLWLALIFAITGMYLMNDFGELKVSFGNLLVLLSATIWALHVQAIDKLAKSYSASHLAFSQFAVAALLSFIFMLPARFLEHGASAFGAAYWQGIAQAGMPILYGGIMSAGIGYTLQIVAQRRAEPAHAAVILSSEGVFALIGGYFVLSEKLNAKMLIGAVLLLFAMLILQIFPKKSLTE